MPDSILIVDDERGIRETLRAVMEDEGFVADAVATGEECLQGPRAACVRLRAAGCLAAGNRRPGNSEAACVSRVPKPRW